MKFDRAETIDVMNMKKAFENKKDYQEYLKTKEIDAEKNAIREYKDKIESRKIMYSNFKENAKVAILQIALATLCEMSIKNITDQEMDACNGLIESYIKDVGYYNIVRKMGNSRNLLLRELAEDIKETVKDSISGADENDESTYTINKDTVDKFVDQIEKNDDVNDVTNIIRLRVSNAEEDFVNRNDQDSENIKTILKDTAERVQDAKDTNDNDYSDAVEESAMREAKNKIYAIQHEAYRPPFDRIVRAIAKSSLKSSNELVTENRIDMDATVAVARSVYTVLEMLSITSLENVDEAYINETINSL